MGSPHDTATSTGRCNDGSSSSRIWFGPVGFGLVGIGIGAGPARSVPVVSESVGLRLDISTSLSATSRMDTVVPVQTL